MVTSIDTVHRLDHLVVGFTWHGECSFHDKKMTSSRTFEGASGLHFFILTANV